MTTRGLCSAVAGLIAVCCATASCAAASAPARGLSIVALGDSVPRGTNCDCRPYPPLTADGLGSLTRKKVAIANDSVAGYTTSDVLQQLSTKDSVVEHLRTAGI